MIWILGAEGIFAALFLLTGWSVFSVSADQMKHTLWHGITAYDVIFPLFIFLSGVSLGIAAKPMHQYPIEEQGKKIRHAIKRLALLIALGVLYNHSWGTGIPLMIDESSVCKCAWSHCYRLVFCCDIRLVSHNETTGHCFCRHFSGLLAIISILLY